MAELTWENVTRIMERRREEDSELKRDMMSIRDRYNADIAIPLEDVKGNPVLESPVPAIIAETIDGMAMQAASTKPMIAVPALDFGDPNSRERASRRRRAYQGVWHKAQLNLLMRRLYRHMTGYGVAAIMVQPDYKNGLPTIRVRDPLSAYPDQQSPEEIRNPIDVGFVIGRSPSWIRHFYPEATTFVNESRGEDMWDMLEWVDQNNIMIGILGPREGRWPNQNRGEGMLLRQYPNLAGMVPAVVPQRVTMDKIAGQVSKITGMTDLMGRIMALEVIAAERAVFPDRYVIARQNQRPVIAGGRWRDGREGDTNLLENVEAVGQLVGTVGPSTNMTLSYLERAARMSGGAPGIFGGELTGAIRSGQTIMQAGAYSVDPRIQEMQESMQYVLECMNRAIYGCFKGYWPSKKYTFFSGQPGDFDHVEFTVSGDLENDEQSVYYPFPGADANAITVAVGQALGSGILSRRSGMAKHPFVDDPEFEQDQQTRESLVDALKAAITQGVVGGSLAEVDVARMIELTDQGKDFPEAVQIAHKEAQVRQASQAPTPAPGTAAPGAAPESMPGLTGGAAGAEMQPPPTVQPPPQGAQNMREVLNAIRSRG